MRTGAQVPGAASPPTRYTAVIRGRWADVVVLAGFTAISFLYFGLRLLPHPGRYLVGEPGQRDPEIFVWSFAWWPHAIGQLTNPFVTHVIYAPTGINLMWATAVPGLALAFSPVTLLFGPDISYNVAALLLPALAAWSAYRLCRYLTGSLWASLVGGYLFGFSSYMLGHQLAGHLNLTGVFVLPLVALVLVRYVRRELGTRGLAWRLGLLLALQLTISTEVLLTLTIMLALGVVLALALLPCARRRLLTSLGAIAAGYGLAGLLTAPFLYYLLQGYTPGTYVDRAFFSADLANLVLPTRLIALGGPSLADTTNHFSGNLNEQGFYLGLPILAIVAVFALQARRLAIVRYLLAALVVVTVLALGPALRVDGHRVIWSPWALVANQPLVNNVLPARLALFAWLIVGVFVALWISARRSRIAVAAVLPVIAVAALVPAVQRDDFDQRPERWAFFSDGLYKQCVPRDETLAVFPFGRWGDSLLWQAESDFWFRMAEGNMGRSSAYPPNFVGDPTVAELTFQFIDPTIRPTMAELLRYARSHHVDRFASVEIHAYPDGTMMHSFGALQSYGGVLVAPACGHVSLMQAQAPYTQVLQSQRRLARAHRLLLAASGDSALETPRRMIVRTDAVLHRIRPNDLYNADLREATRLVDEARRALTARTRSPRSEPVRRRLAESIRRADRALRRYASHINSGIAG